MTVASAEYDGSAPIPATAQGSHVASDVFVSYAREDLALCERICRGLGVRGWSFWLDRSALMPGTNWREAARNGIAGAAVVLVVATESSAASRECRRELAIARCLGKQVILYTPEGGQSESVITALADASSIISSSEDQVMAAVSAHLPVGRTRARLEIAARRPREDSSDFVGIGGSREYGRLRNEIEASGGRVSAPIWICEAGLRQRAAATRRRHRAGALAVFIVAMTLLGAEVAIRSMTGGAERATSQEQAATRSRLLAARAQRFPSTAGLDLAVQAVSASPTAEAVDALRSALARTPHADSLASDRLDGAILSVGISAGGSRLALSATGDVLYNGRHYRLPVSPVRAGTIDAVSPRAAILDGHGEYRIWDLGMARPSQILGAGVTLAAADHRLTTHALATGATVSIINAAPGAPPGQVCKTTVASDVTAMAVSAAGDAVAVGTRRGDVLLVNVVSCRATPLPPPHYGRTSSITRVTVSDGGTVVGYASRQFSGVGRWDKAHGFVETGYRDVGEGVTVSPDARAAVRTQRDGIWTAIHDPLDAFTYADGEFVNIPSPQRTTDPRDDLPPAAAVERLSSGTWVAAVGTYGGEVVSVSVRDSLTISRPVHDRLPGGPAEETRPLHPLGVVRGGVLAVSGDIGGTTAALQLWHPSGAVRTWTPKPLAMEWDNMPRWSTSVDGDLLQVSRRSGLSQLLTSQGKDLVIPTAGSAISPSGETVVTAAGNGVRVRSDPWGPDHPGKSKTISLGASPAEAMVGDPIIAMVGDEQVLVGESRGRIRLVDLRIGRVTATTQLPVRLTQLVARRQGDLAVAVTQDGVEVLKLPSLDREASQHLEGVFRPTISPDGGTVSVRSSTSVFGLSLPSLRTVLIRDWVGANRLDATFDAVPLTSTQIVMPSGEIETVCSVCRSAEWRALLSRGQALLRVFAMATEKDPSATAGPQSTTSSPGADGRAPSATPTSPSAGTSTMPSAPSAPADVKDWLSEVLATGTRRDSNRLRSYATASAASALLQAIPRPGMQANLVWNDHCPPSPLGSGSCEVLIWDPMGPGPASIYGLIYVRTPAGLRLTDVQARGSAD
jgi:hypothetical protein